MNKIIIILMFGLLGFLGCSDSDDGTSAVTGEAIPVAPFGIIDTLDPIYEWTSVPGATKYRLLVQDANETVVIDEWYTAEESGCASEEVLCTGHPGIVTVSEYTWKVQACANQVCGLWSELLNYSWNGNVSTSSRFTDHGNGTVTDNNTQLMWTKHANSCVGCTHLEAANYCEQLEYYTYIIEKPTLNDWHLPSISGLRSLRDPMIIVGGPLSRTAIVENPFTEVQQGWYWTHEIQDIHTPSLVYVVGIIGLADVYGAVKISQSTRTDHATWCCRYVNGQ